MIDGKPLLDKEVHVWFIDLNAQIPLLHTLFTLLSPDERERSGRFRFSRDQARFIVAHGAMRQILSRYIDIPPSELAFISGPYGKLALAPGLDGNGLRFNLSHSEDMALLAVAWRQEVGVDIERIRADLDFEQIVDRFYTPAEQRMLKSVTGTLRLRMFYRYWTLKEAVMKALGLGMQLSPDHVEITLATGNSPARVRLMEGSGLSDAVVLRELSGDPTWVGAVAVVGDDYILREYRWNSRSS